MSAGVLKEGKTYKGKQNPIRYRNIDNKREGVNEEGGERNLSESVSTGETR